MLDKVVRVCKKMCRVLEIISWVHEQRSRDNNSNVKQSKSSMPENVSSTRDNKLMHGIISRTQYISISSTRDNILFPIVYKNVYVPLK